MRLQRGRGYMNALFTEAGPDTWLPTDLARGPWNPEALHGGPVAALLARAVEPLLAPLQPARLTIELLRPVPVAPLQVSATVTRDGRSVRVVQASVVHDGVTVASATALGIRTKPLEVPTQPSDGPLGPSHGVERDRSAEEYDAFHNFGVEHRFVDGLLGIPGPATDWIRLRFPVVLGETASPLQRVAAAADFGNGISGLGEMQQLLFINPDLTIHLHRLPVGEWICLDAHSRYEDNGIGLAVSTPVRRAGPDRVLAPVVAARRALNRARRRHRGPCRSRQVHVGPRAHRHGPRSLRRGEAARPHHRPRLRVDDAAVRPSGRVRRRPRPCALPQEHARRCRRGRRMCVRRRGDRGMEAAVRRAPAHPGAARRAPRGRRADQGRARRRATTRSMARLDVADHVAGTFLEARRSRGRRSPRQASGSVPSDSRSTGS